MSKYEQVASSYNGRNFGVADSRSGSEIRSCSNYQACPGDGRSSAVLTLSKTISHTLQDVGGSYHTHLPKWNPLILEPIPLPFPITAQEGPLLA